MAPERLKPRPLKGFQDFLPPEARLRERIVETFCEVFRLFGFAPMDTPALEPEEILLSDYGVDANKQIYRFTDLEKNRVGLRFDLTVSLARVIAASGHLLPFPFKRYQVGKVWRFDKPKRGRFREFLQLDADIVGAQPYEPEVELLAAVHQAFARLGITGYYIRINDRKYLADVLQELGIEDSRAKDTFRVLDKLEHQGEEKVFKELTGQLLLQDFDSALEYERMQEVKVSPDTARELLRRTQDSGRLRGYLSGFLQRLTEEGVPPEKVRADASLTRGLDYYTGFVCELMLEGAESVGSVGGGGRYDDLIGRYAPTSPTGVGLSIGVDRLLAALKLAGSGSDSSPVAVGIQRSSAAVFVAVFDDGEVSQLAAVARRLRNAGIPTELWLKPGNREGKSLSRQLKYADRAGIPLAVIAGSDELGKLPPTVQLKDLRTEFGEAGKQIEVPIEGLVGKVKDLLSGATES